MPRCSTAASVFSKVRELGTNNASIVTGNSKVCFGQYSTIPKLFVSGLLPWGEKENNQCCISPPFDDTILRLRMLHVSHLSKKAGARRAVDSGLQGTQNMNQSYYECDMLFVTNNKPCKYTCSFLGDYLFVLLLILDHGSHHFTFAALMQSTSAAENTFNTILRIC